MSSKTRVTNVSKTKTGNLSKTNVPKSKTSNVSKTKVVSQTKVGHNLLFLLEFLVEELDLNTKCECDKPPGETCVSFQFLDNDPLDVCEGDFSADNKYSQKSSNKSGKSCLFAVTPDQAEKAQQTFDLDVNIFRKMKPGIIPERILIGSTKISVKDQFTALLQSDEAAIPGKVLQDTYILLDANGNSAGRITVYIRISSYGRNIITQFQMNMNDKSVLFKDKAGHSLYRYRKTKPSKSNKVEDISESGGYPSCCPGPSFMPPQYPSNNPYLQYTTNQEIPMYGGETRFYGAQNQYGEYSDPVMEPSCRGQCGRNIR